VNQSLKMSVIQKFLKGHDLTNFVERYPRLEPLFDILNGPSIVSVDEKSTTDILNQVDNSTEFKPDIHLSLMGGDSETWVEFLSDTKSTPFVGIKNKGTHIIYGSGIEKQVEDDITTYNMYHMSTIVDADYGPGFFVVRDIVSVDVSPIIVCYSESSMGQSYVGYTTAGILSQRYHNEPYMVESDIKVHRMAFIHLDRLDFQNRQAAKKATEALPTWLRSQSP
jgi:hypothetical protein